MSAKNSVVAVLKCKNVDTFLMLFGMEVKVGASLRTDSLPEVEAWSYSHTLDTRKGRRIVTELEIQANRFPGRFADKVGECN